MIPAGLTKIDPRRFDLSSRLSLFENELGNIFFCVNRKSRFIMKDTNLFLERAENIKAVTGKLPQLLISSPICSKSTKTLTDAGVIVLPFDSDKI